MNLRETWIRCRTSAKNFRSILKKHCDDDKCRKYYLRRGSRSIY